MSTIKMIAGITAALVATTAAAQYDSQTLVDTNNNSTSTSTVTSTNTNNNTNNNINDTTVTSTTTNTSTSVNTNSNNNVNTTTSDNTNRNINTATSDNTNRNINTNTSDNTNRNISESNSVQSIDSNNVNRNINDNTVNQRVEQPPPTAVAPSMMSGGNNDLCTTGVSGAVQTQIMGISSGGTVRDKNCERLKNAKTLYDMGMKVAAVSVLCQDRRVFDAMWNAGTPCPFEGQIGEQARVAWQANPDRIPAPEPEETDDFYAKASFGALLGWLLFIL
jgi:hypothetical protein